MSRDVGSSEDSVWYVPDIDDNRSDPLPVRVLLEPMTAEDVRRYQRHIGKTKAMKRGDAMGAFHDHQRRVFADRVKVVENYRCNGVDIRTGADLFEYGEAMVADDVWSALQNMSLLTEGALGKFDSQCDSVRQETLQPGNGLAHDARATPAATTSDN